MRGSAYVSDVLPLAGAVQRGAHRSPTKPAFLMYSPCDVQRLYCCSRIVLPKGACVFKGDNPLQGIPPSVSCKVSSGFLFDNPLLEESLAVMKTRTLHGKRQPPVPQDWRTQERIRTDIIIRFSTRWTSGLHWLASQGKTNGRDD